MKRNPLIPFGIIAVLGIVLVIVLSIWGGNTVQERKAAEKGGTEQKQTAQKPEKIFAENCTACHGQNLEGGAGPNLQHIGAKLSKEQS